MCGLVGMMGPGIMMDDMKMMKDLAYINGLRGRDGAGILQGFGSKWKQEYKVCKTWQEISYLLWFNEWSSKGDRKFLNDYQSNFFAVHSRWATVGAHSDENSHPFDFTNLVGMHNGTLEDTKYFHHTKTDSEMMFDEMDKRGVIPVLKDLNKKSAYAIVVFDKNSGELVFARNKERPLYFAHNTERGVCYWASEIDFLKLAAGRNKIKLSAFVYLAPDKVYRVNPCLITKDDWPEWVATDLFPKGESTETKTIPPVSTNKVTQENIEIERAIAKGEELISNAKAARSSTALTRHTPRILDGSVDSSRIWENVANVDDLPWDDDVFDSVLPAEATGPEDMRFNPARIPAYRCDFCDDKLNLLEKWYATIWYATAWKDSVICRSCSELAKETETEKIQCH